MVAYDSVMVTGGAGFIGSHTVDELLHKGSEVWVLDSLMTGSLGNLHAWKKNPKFRFVKGSVTNPRIVETLAAKTDAIIHLAAVVSPYLSVKKPEMVNKANVSGTLNVLRAAVKKKVKRLVFASSSSVYGNQVDLPISENNLLTPVSPYGVSKLSGEKYCGAFYQTYALETISLRYFNVYGPRQRANPYSGVIAIFADALSNGKRPKIYGDGAQTRDFVNVSDVVQANLRALESNNGMGRAFNVGTGHATTINDLFAILAKTLGKTTLEPIYAPERQGDIKDSYADISEIKDVLGFEPKTGLEQGLRSLIRPDRP